MKNMNQIKHALKKSLASVMLAAVLSGLGVTAASAQHKTLLAEGNPPLTSEMVGHLRNLFAWSLDINFTAEDDAALEKQIVAYWRANDQTSVKAVLNMLAFEKNLANAGEEKRRELQPQMKQKLLETMSGERDEPLNRLLLGIYASHQNFNSQTAEANGGAESLGNLIGKWQVLHGNSLVSVDINSGRIGDGNQMIAEYDIRPDGRVIFTFLLQQSNYGCTTRIKTSKTGRAQISDSRITFNYDGGTTTSEDGCNAKYNYTKKLAPETETFQYKVGRRDGKTQFCFENNKLNDCAVKVK